MTAEEPWEPDGLLEWTKACAAMRAQKPLTMDEVPVWSEGWVAGYAAGRARVAGEDDGHRDAAERIACGCKAVR